MGNIFDALVALSPEVAIDAKHTSEYVLIRCPFHANGQERTPSMSVSLVKPVFFCHGCKEGGRVQRLLRHYGASITLSDKLVARSGLTSGYSPEAKSLVSNDSPLVTTSVSGNKSRGAAYVLDEGVLDEYRLAPKRLLDAGFLATTLQSFGVGVDELNGRITFPLRDFTGNLMGISGRSYLGQDPKYKIYNIELTSRGGLGIPPDYSLDSVKGQLLWNGYRAFPLLNGGDQLIITEGFKAAMWVWQCGHKSVVALLGSYLTREHAERISKSSKDPRVTLFLDGDEAGEVGTKKAISRLLKKGVRVHVATYPEGKKQPDDLSQEETTHAIKNSQTYIEWQLNGA